MDNKNVFEYHDDLFKNDVELIKTQVVQHISQILNNRSLSFINTEVTVPKGQKISQGLVGVEIKLYNPKTDMYIKFPIGGWKSMEIQKNIDLFLEVIL